MLGSRGSGRREVQYSSAGVHKVYQVLSKQIGWQALGLVLISRIV